MVALLIALAPSGLLGPPCPGREAFVVGGRYGHERSTCGLAGPSERGVPGLPYRASILRTSFRQVAKWIVNLEA